MRLFRRNRAPAGSALCVSRLERIVRHGEIDRPPGADMAVLKARRSISGRLAACRASHPILVNWLVMSFWL